jgi:hypothetical protein
MRHGGVQAGFTSELWLIPSRRLAVAVFPIAAADRSFAKQRCTNSTSYGEG